MAIRFQDKSEPGKPPKKAEVSPRVEKPASEMPASDAPEGELPLDGPALPFAKPVKPKKRGK